MMAASGFSPEYLSGSMWGGAPEPDNSVGELSHLPAKLPQSPQKVTALSRNGAYKKNSYFFSYFSVSPHGVFFVMGLGPCTDEPHT